MIVLLLDLCLPLLLSQASQRPVFLLIPSEGGCQAIHGIGGGVPILSEPPTRADNAWACGSEGGSLLCFSLVTPASPQKGLFSRNSDGVPIVIFVTKTALSSKAADVFPVGSLTFESERESLILLPDKGGRRHYSMRTEAFFSIGDGRYGSITKVCSGTMDLAPKGLAAGFNMEFARLESEKGRKAQSRSTPTPPP